MTAPKTPIQSIVILSAEGPIGRVPFGGLFLNTWEAAETFITTVASEKTTGGYDKVHFRLNYTDGFVYEGRIDVTRDMSTGAPLARHVRMFNTNRSGRGTVPADTLAAYDAHDPDGRANAARMLDEYQIGFLLGGDVAAPAAPATVCGKCGAPFASHVQGRGCVKADPFEGVVARIRALPEAKRAALLGMLAALEG